jgi:hypothetical protein
MSGPIPGPHKGVVMVKMQCGPNFVVNSVVSLFQVPVDHLVVFWFRY